MNKVSNRALSLLNDHVAAMQAGCPNGWKRYRVSGSRFFAPSTATAWRRWCLLRLGDLGIAALAILAVWAFLAGGAR